MPQSNSLSLNTSSHSEVYFEPEDSYVEPTIEDIHEFARRIGIDPVQESHLLHIAEEGLREKLPPHWKPCVDKLKDEWYYFNTETLASQWEHPLNEVYREKVAQMKADIAMNRIQNFNPGLGLGDGRQGKNLPPLKTRPYLPVPPLIPDTIGIGRPQSQPHMQKESSSSVFGPTTNSLLRSQSQLHTSSQKQPVSILSKTSSDTDVRSQSKPEPFSARGPGQLSPIQQLARKPTGGLTLSGSGASFLKSNSTEENENEIRKDDSSSSEESSSHKNAVAVQSSSEEMSLKEPIIRRPTSAMPGNRRALSALKISEPQPFQSTLAKTMQKSQALITQLSNAQPNSFPWSINPISFTGNEKDSRSNLSRPDDKSKVNKPSVKFKLDENPELHFEDSKSEKQTGENSEAESTDDAFNVDEESDDQKQKPSMSGFTDSGDSRPKTATISQMQNGITRGTQDSQKLRTGTDGREQGEKQMKDQLQESLAQLRQQNEQLIRKTKFDLEKSRQSQYEKFKREIEQTFAAEVEKIRAENQAKLEIRRKELSTDFEKSLKDIELEIKSMNKESVLQKKREEFMKELEQEIQTEMKELKEIMREEQKKQIQQMKDYHLTFIEKMKQEFNVEDEKIRKEHAVSIADTIVSLNRDREQLVSTLRKQQDAELEQLRKDFDEKKQSYESEIRQFHIQANGDAFITKSKPDTNRVASSGDEVGTKAPHIEKESELREVKAKYKQLEEKYRQMKQDLQHVVVHATNEIKSSKKLVPVQDETSNVATSNDATTDDEQHQHQNNDRSSSLHDSVISNNSTVAANTENGKKVISINDIIAGSDDRLNKALAALENLRDQIIEIKSEQELNRAGEVEGSTNKKTVAKSQAPKLRTGSRSKNSTNVYPTKDYFVYNQNNESLPVAKAKKTISRIRASASTSDLRTLDDNNNRGSDRNSRQMVETAKDFIRAQKHRLGLSSLNSANSSPSPSHHNLQQSTFPRFKRIDDLVVHSDATNDESSGIGTLYTNPRLALADQDATTVTTKQRTQVAKDIDGILASLKQLDKQMKYMWSVVGNKPTQRVNKDDYQPTLLSPLIHPVSAPTMEHLEALARNANGNKGAGNFWNESGRRYRELNLINSAIALSDDITSPDFINSKLAEELSRMKSHKQYVETDNAEASASNFKMTPDLLEKTKDLREWLQNF